MGREDFEDVPEGTPCHIRARPRGHPPKGLAPAKIQADEEKVEKAGDLGFEAKFSTLASHRNRVGNAHFLGVFREFYTVWHCIGIGSALAIFAEELQKIRRPLSAR